MAQQLKVLQVVGAAGLNYITDGELAFAEVVTIKRNGIREFQIETEPTGMTREVLHDASTGKIIWSSDRRFNQTEVDEFGALLKERVHVIYKGGGGEIIDTPPVEIPDPPVDPPVDPAVFSGPFKFSTSTLLVCEETEVTRYHSGFIMPGSILYEDAGLTVPVIGPKIMLDVYTNTMYLLNLSTGEVISVIGSC